MGTVKARLKRQRNQPNLRIIFPENGISSRNVSKNICERQPAKRRPPA
jgi:hypothetical protein